MYVLGGRPTFVDSKDINKDKSNQIKSNQTSTHCNFMLPRCQVQSVKVIFKNEIPRSKQDAGTLT